MLNLVAQFAVPKRLLGVAVGAIFAYGRHHSQSLHGRKSGRQAGAA
jgi:hypothetical protein